MTHANSWTVNPGWRLLLTDLGLRPADVLRRAGLPDDLFGQERAALSTDEYFRLWWGIEAEAADPSLLDAAPLAFDESLTDLARLNARQAAIVEMKFLGGLACEEIARLLEVSKRTVELDWKMSRTWLANGLRKKGKDR